MQVPGRCGGADGRPLVAIIGAGELDGDAFTSVVSILTPEMVSPADLAATREVAALIEGRTTLDELVPRSTEIIAAVSPTIQKAGGR